MDFKLTSEQEMIRDTTRDFTERNIKPVAARMDAHIASGLADYGDKLTFLHAEIQVFYSLQTT